MELHRGFLHASMSAPPNLPPQGVMEGKGYPVLLAEQKLNSHLSLKLSIHPSIQQLGWWLLDDKQVNLINNRVQEENCIKRIYQEKGTKQRMNKNTRPQSIKPEPKQHVFDLKCKTKETKETKSKLKFQWHWKTNCLKTTLWKSQGGMQSLYKIT